MKKPTEFTSKVISLIKKIPKGKVATYGQIAKLTGRPNGSRGVVWILNSSSESHKLPWHRVINSQGKISFPVNSSSFKKQKKLLQKEGIEFLSANELDLKIYGWKKTYKPAKRSRKLPQMFND